MFQSRLFMILLFGMAICICLPARCWPPSEDEKTQWQDLIRFGKTTELEKLINELKQRDENVRKWVTFTADFRSGSLLSQAAQYGHIPIAKLLIENGAGINTKEHGYTPIHMAVQNNHPEMLNFLLKCGASADGENDITESPLIQAIRNGQIEMVKTLLKHGASVHPKRSNAPLAEAARTGNTQIITLLLERGAHVDGGLLGGSKRPLERAAAGGHLEAVEQLLTAGAKINLQTYLQETALHSAAENGHEEIVRYLLERGAHVEGENPEAAPLSEEELSERAQVRGMLWRNADYEDERFARGSPLNRAAGNGHVSIAALLLEHGADVRNVQGDARAALQQIQTSRSGLEENFHQYITKSGDFQISTGLSSSVPFSKWLVDQMNNMTVDFRPIFSGNSSDLINQAVLLTTLDLPDTINLRNQNGKRVTRIESYIISADFIKTANIEARKRSSQLRIILTDEENKRTPYLLIKSDPQMWATIMESAAVLGANVDPVFFYQNAHHELADVEYEWVAEASPIGATKLIHSVKKKTPLKQYWGKQDVHSEDVYIPQDYFNKPCDEETNSADENIRLFMQWHRGVMARIMVLALRDYIQPDQSETPVFVNVFCLGCGTGEDVLACCKALNNEKNITYNKVIGVENCVDLAWNAMLNSITESVKHSAVHTGFTVGDAYKSAKLIENFTYRRRSNSTTVVVAEDFLVHRVLPGVYSALRILHQLIQPEAADLVVTGGVHHPLVSERIASAAGWDVQQIEIYHSREISGYQSSRQVGHCTANQPTPSFVLKRMDKKRQMEKVYQRSLKRSDDLMFNSPPPFTILDLSMFGLPQDALEYFLGHEQNGHIRQIDLSYSHIDADKLLSTVNMLMGFPALKQIIASGFEPWFKIMVSYINKQQRLGLVQRMDNQYRHELPSLEPDTARLLGHYVTIPSQEIYTPPKAQPLGVTEPTAIHPEQEFLSPIHLVLYYQQLLRTLSTHNLGLRASPIDNLCFFHAVAVQLDMTTSALQQILVNQLRFNLAAVEAELPSFTGEQFQALISELQQGQWGSSGLARLISWIFNKRVVMLYFNCNVNHITVHVYNPNGSGSEEVLVSSSAALSEDQGGQSVILVNNGLGRWLSVFRYKGKNGRELVEHNNKIVNPESSLAQRPSIPSGQLYTPSIITPLLTLLMTFWNAKHN